MNKDLYEISRQWVEEQQILGLPQDDIAQLIAQQNHLELHERFYRQLSFGTGGLRGLLQGGTAGINCYTIRKASCAVAKTLPPHSKVIIAHDTRNQGRLLSEQAAGIFAEKGHQVLLFSQPAPVPLLSFAVRFYQAQAGIVLTASHNPKEYNGYKVYNQEGAQVVSPQDGEIEKNYEKISLEEMKVSASFSQYLQEEKIIPLDEDFYSHYIQAITPCFDRELITEHSEKLHLVYTPLHGAGMAITSKLLKNLDFKKITFISEQMTPDGDFSTVSSPNPEDPEALNLAAQKMLETGGDLALANDPDADRLGVVINHQGDLFYPTGNQIALLMFDYLLQKKELTPPPTLIKTIVTSPLLEKMAQAHNLNTYNTLTGFKWIAHLIKTKGISSFFGCEESFGQLIHPQCRDKDGVSSAAFLGEVALFHKIRGKNLKMALDEIYQKYGFTQEKLLSFTLKGSAGKEKIAQMMAAFRKKQMPFHQEISAIIDYRRSIAELPPSDVLKLSIDDDSCIYVRPSGTEPKIKFYLMFTGNPQNDLETQKKFIKQKTSEWEKKINDFNALFF